MRAMHSNRLRSVRNNVYRVTRFINAFLAGVSHRAGHRYAIGMPEHVMIEPTSHCNLKCPLCPTGNDTIGRPRGFMSYTEYTRIVDQLAPYCRQIELFSYGESFLHKDAFDMIKYAKRLDMRVIVSTNGYVFRGPHAVDNLIDSGLDYLRVGLDGMSQETYSVFRKGGDLAPLIEGLRSLAAGKERRQVSHPTLELQFIVIRANEHEIDEVRSFASELNAVLRLKSIGLRDLQAHPEDKEWLPANTAYSRYDGSVLAGATRKDRSKPGRCYHPWKRLVINWDGSTSPCCYDPSASHSYGNVIDASVRRAWRSQTARTFRTQHDAGKVPMCVNCPVRLWPTSRYSTYESPSHD